MPTPASDCFDQMTLYGISNCTTVKQARAWLAAHGHPVGFHDYRKQGIDAAWLQGVVAQTGWQPLLNTRGTTWRKLDPAAQASAGNEAGAIALMLTHSSVIKRPLLERDGHYHLGFTDDQYQALFGA